VNPAKLPRAADPNTLYILDISGYVFRAYHALPPLSNSKGEPTGAVYGVTSMLAKFLKTMAPQRLAVAMDVGGKSVRSQVFEAYKANRPPAPPDLALQVKRVEEVLKALRMQSFFAHGYEADDIIATMVKRAKSSGIHVVVVTQDKDLLQLVDETVVVYDSMRERVMGTEETVTKLGVKPEQVVDYLALTGDSIDNVPGIPSVGPKTAVALLQQFGDLETLLNSVDQIARPALREKVRTHADQARLSQKLVSLHADMPIDIEFESLRYEGPDRENLRALLLDLEFTRLLPEFDLQNVVISKADKAPAAQSARNADALRSWVDNIDHGEPLALAYGFQGSGLELTHLTLTQAGREPLNVTQAILRTLDLRQTLKPILTSEQPIKVLSDVKRFARALNLLDETWAGIFDVTLASYLVAVERRSHTLITLAREELQLDLAEPTGSLFESQGLLPDGDEPLIDPQDLALRAEHVDALLRVHPILNERLESFGLSKLYNEVEIPLTFTLARMESQGVRVDLELLEQLDVKIRKQLVELEKKCWELAEGPFNVASPRQLETVLFDKLGLPAKKKTKTARSTDHEVLEELATLHPLPQTILESRKLAKLLNTYVEALPQQVDKKTGRIHTQFNQTIAATGRLSSSDPNLQNIPIRDEVGRSLRHAFIADPEWLVLSADYSQIELRILAHLSQDPLLVDAFRHNVDVHVRTASAIFAVDESQVTSEMRGRAKTVNFAVLYGQGAFALARNLKIERSEASQYIKAFFARYEGVRSFLDQILARAKETGAVHTMLGRRRAIPDLKSPNHNLRTQAERIACNTPIQGTAADIIKLAMLKADRAMLTEHLRSRMLLSVHDELVFEVHPEERIRMEALVLDAMQHAFALDVPLLVELDWGKSWGEAH